MYCISTAEAETSSRAPVGESPARRALCLSLYSPPYTSLPHSHVSFLSSSHGWLRFFAHGASTWSPSK